MYYVDDKYFEERSKMYARLAKVDLQTCPKDATYFSFGTPDAGWINMKVFVNGTCKFEHALSVAFDPFPDLRRWLEDIVKEDSLCHTLRIECEGSAIYMNYENLYTAEVGCHIIHEENRCIDYDAFTNPSIGLFYIYFDDTRKIPVQAICNTREFVKSIYLAMLYFCSTGKKCKEEFAQSWYYHENEGCDPDKLWDNWHFYNTIKSPLLEWDFQSRECYRHCRPKFKSIAPVTETIHMWCEYGDALFWTTGGCCGTADELWTDHGSFDLKGIAGLREWYDEFDDNPSYSWPEKKVAEHRKRGLEFAQKVRAILPDSIDLYYEDWYPAIDTSNNKYGLRESLPMIVFNDHTLIEK